MYDIISVGDTAIDDFIRLKEAEVHCEIDKEGCVISMRFGDKIPFESSTIVYGVGNAANVAVSAARLGLKTAFVSNVGDDERGVTVLKHFKKERVATQFIKKHKGATTNYHYVLWYGDERTILINHHPYPYAFPKGLPKPKTLYLTSIASGTEKYHDEIADYLESHPDIFFAFQPGTFQIKVGAENLKRLYARADFYVLNKEEAARVLGMEKDHSEKTEVLLEKLHALGPKIVVITDGRNGVHALENGTAFHMPMYPDPAPPKERTGAGDAFASTTVSYLTMGFTLKESMQRGLVNSAYKMQGIGGQETLLTRAKLEEILAKNPSVKPL